ncbi:hypothetical protein R1flu_009089 [Riccia fluitans]|uniref:Uncharacterized protein n=1 Tax=Riccia fluitans TaxID=41844 RepID=A0ABD1Z126_9MARC
MDETGRLHSRRWFTVSPSVEVLPLFVDRFRTEFRSLNMGFDILTAAMGGLFLRTRFATELCVMDSVHVP